MKKKLLLMLLIIVLTIGYAGVNTNLFVEVYSSFAFNESDLKVYFSGAYLDDEDYSNEIISEDKSMITISEVSALSKISYDITNASKEYDAIVNVECTSSTGGITFTNEDENLLISAREVGVSSTNVSGTVTNSTITCKLKVKASGRTTSSNKTLANADEYVIYGTLKDSGGGALANSNVVIYSEEPHYATTDEEGYLFYNGLEKGAHEIYYVNDTLENIKKMSKEQVKSASTVSGRFTTSSSGNIVLTNGSISSFGSMEVTPFCESLVGTTWNYDYTGSEQSFITYCDGTYKMELWGAQGGKNFVDDGNAYSYDGHSLGGYTKGNIKILSNSMIYVYVGKNGDYLGEVSFNGGGRGGYSVNYYTIPSTIVGTTSSNFGNSGGGATDIRLVNGSWNNFDSLKSRIMVAAGGGGDGSYSYSGQNSYAGGLTGYKGNYYQGHGDRNCYGFGGTQVGGGSGGINLNSYGVNEAGVFGIGGTSNSYSSSANSSGVIFIRHGLASGGGGGGYYGGGSGGGTGGGGVGHGGGGGSSFISGHNGCDAITESSTEDNIVHTGQPNHYLGYIFTDTVMIDGSGYSWTNVKGSTVAGMPTHDGTGTMTGNSGNGYAKITLIALN